MSWIFGYKSQVPPPQPPGDNNNAAPSPPTAPLTTSERKAMDAYRFDSSALERAAEAAKTLERSSNLNIIISKLFPGKLIHFHNF